MVYLKLNFKPYFLVLIFLMQLFFVDILIKFIFQSLVLTWLNLISLQSH